MWIKGNFSTLEWQFKFCFHWSLSSLHFWLCLLETREGLLYKDCNKFFLFINWRTPSSFPLPVLQRRKAQIGKQRANSNKIDILNLNVYLNCINCSKVKDGINGTTPSSFRTIERFFPEWICLDFFKLGLKAMCKFVASTYQGFQLSSQCHKQINVNVYYNSKFLYISQVQLKSVVFSGSRCCRLVIYYTALYYTTLHYTGLYYTELQYTALYFTKIHYTALYI